MEHLFEARVILGILCLIHIFINYAGARGAYRGHINKKLLNSLFVIEIFAVTAYVIYDNIQTPPQDGWFFAIVGYLFVYGMMFLTWALHCIYALLEPDKVYEMTVKNRRKLFENEYLQGTVVEENHNLDVYLPYSENLDLKKDTNKQQNVKFKEVLRGTYIIVELA